MVKLPFFKHYHFFVILKMAFQMQSQEDMFDDTDLTKKKVTYDVLVLCDKDENVKHPFGLYPRAMFSAIEISDRWLDSILDDSSRLKSLNTLQGLQDKQIALFGKVEEGIILKNYIKLNKINL